jgi:hypothetical protein
MRIFSKNSMSSDGLIGEATIKVSSLCFPNFDDWFEVSKDGEKTGAIHFKSLWEPKVDHTHDEELARKEAELA